MAAARLRWCLLAGGCLLPASAVVALMVLLLLLGLPVAALLANSAVDGDLCRRAAAAILNRGSQEGQQCAGVRTRGCRRAQRACAERAPQRDKSCRHKADSTVDYCR